MLYLFVGYQLSVISHTETENPWFDINKKYNKNLKHLNLFSKFNSLQALLIDNLE